MKSLFVALLAFTTTAVAQMPPPKPLPDAATLLTQLQQNQKAIDEIRKNYVWTEDEQEYELDKQGNTKKVEKRQYEVYSIAGTPIRRLLSKEGVPLDDSDRRKEQERVAKAEKKAREQRQKRDRGEHDKGEITVRDFLETSRFTNIRREQYRDDEVIAMDFEPNPRFHADNRVQSLVNKLSGTIWIDEAAHQVARLEAKLTKSQSFGLGLASVKEGSGFSAEQSKVNGELWMPLSVDASISARVVFAGLRRRVAIQYSNYRKFKSETKIVGVEEVKK